MRLLEGKVVRRREIRTELEKLRPGARFEVEGTKVTGTVVRVTPCAVTVELGSDGGVREFVAHNDQDEEVVVRIAGGGKRITFACSTTVIARV